MTKVERLRDDLCQQIVDHDSFAGTLASTVLKAIDSLISASHAEGVAEGVDKLAEKCADAFNEGVQDTVADLALVGDAEAFARGKAEGAEQERERIRGLSREFKVGDTLIINAPTLLLESSVFHSRRGK